jgi:Tol biopolymer transport system component
MGEVYRARDTRLNREVAVKVLPANFSSDEKLRERFDREARAISSLNHPNICTLHDVGRESGIDYLVLEYIEGESLAHKLERGPLPMQQVLSYGSQIAEALERAHKQGVVHRDLKPGNIMVTKTGVKLLDFGLAKPMAGASMAAAALGSMTMSQQQKPLTAEGTLVGTFQYMAPEQLDGREADARSDIFALGCVLYEMAAGKRPFDGRTQASIVAAILAKEPPPISELIPLTPPAFERLVKTCIAKDPDDRWQTAHDVKLQLKWIAEGGSAAGVAAPVIAHRKHREWTAWIAAGICLFAMLGVSAAYWNVSSKAQRLVISSLLLPEKAQFTLMGRNGPPAISVDGTKVAFAATRDNQHLIWVRELSQKDAKPINGTDGGYAPFWSPDGRYLAFFANGKLKRVDIAGGAPEVICDADDARGGSWGSKDVIVFAPNRFSNLFMVPASGGKPEPVTDLGEALSNRWPHFLPDGEHFMFVESPTGSASVDNKLEMASIKDKRVKVVLEATYNFDIADGKIFFMRDGVLNAQSFDASKGEVSGPVTPIATDVQSDSLYSDALFSVSAAGTLVYAPGSVSNLAELAWFDHHGKSLGSLGQPNLYIEVALSADESKVAAIEFTKSTSIDVWIYELARGVHSRFTTTGVNRYPMWAPDGSAIIYGSSKGGQKLSLYRKQVLTDSAPELLASDPAGLVPTDWSPDGRNVAVVTNTKDTKNDISIFSLADKKMTPFLNTPFNELSARFSPDGRWLAFASDESGHYEVYVTPFPAGGRKFQVSTAGGNQPLWARDGKELYYFASDNMITSVSFSAAGGEPKFGIPTTLFRAHPRNFDAVYQVSKDGRFLISSAPDESTAPLTLISNWPAMLKK